MLLEIEDGVFSDQVADVMTVLKLLEFTMERRHDWLPEPSTAETARRYLEAKAPGLASWSEYLFTAATASAWTSTDRLSENASPPVTVTAANVADLVGDLGLPAVIIVENARNDGSLLKAVFGAYDRQLLEALEKHWLRIDHSGGGGDQPWLADEAAKRFQHVCRVMVLKDNDKRLPQQATTPAELASRAAKEPLIHIWWRHEVENYLPDAVLELSPHEHADQLLRHLRSLPTEQQGWIDMKYGLAKSPKSISDAFSPEGRRIWDSGYRKQLPKPLVPDDLTLTLDDFRALGEEVHDELLHLLDKIKRVL
ncbi:hypothetical protein QEZ54_20430 [Catellatospora sp. KI3]|uniref:hypothetical protein n=1 Tax=Catellatospora sp. KI3 TaxID=3041620 RepID=UPI0024823105|nr:hypothetical protein [Catellatospora sp. KI3]MDI1463353.1 hypothetical protein [Catellatospora sp. KI3]